MLYRDEAEAMIFAVWARVGGSLTEMQTNWSTMDLVLAHGAIEARDLLAEPPPTKER